MAEYGLAVLQAADEICNAKPWGRLSRVLAWLVSWHRELLIYSSCTSLLLLPASLLDISYHYEMRQTASMT